MLIEARRPARESFEVNCLLHQLGLSQANTLILDYIPQSVKNSLAKIAMRLISDQQKIIREFFAIYLASDGDIYMDVPMQELLQAVFSDYEQTPADLPQALLLALTQNGLFSVKNGQAIIIVEQAKAPQLTGVAKVASLTADIIYYQLLNWSFTSLTPVLVNKLFGAHTEERDIEALSTYLFHIIRQTKTIRDPNTGRETREPLYTPTIELSTLFSSTIYKDEKATELLLSRQSLSTTDAAEIAGSAHLKQETAAACIGANAASTTQGMVLLSLITDNHIACFVIDRHILLIGDQTMISKLTELQTRHPEKIFRAFHQALDVSSSPIKHMNIPLVISESEEPSFDQEMDRELDDIFGLTNNDES